MTDVAIARFGLGLVGRATDFATLCFVDRLADRAADVAIARLEAGLADRATDITVACLVTGLANRAADIAVARLEAGLANRTADVAVTRLEAGFANRVALVAIARFVDIASAGHRYLLDALLVNRSATGVGLRFPHRFTNRLVARSTAALGGAVGTAGRTRIGRTAFRAGRSTIKGVDFRFTGQGEKACGSE